VTQGWVERARASYDEVAEDYDALLRGLLEREPWERVALDLLVGRVRDAGGGAVLDVGCGTGRVTAYLAGAGLDVSGVDLSPGMVAGGPSGAPRACASRSAT
jgi:SAM-dependent methyltransferase